MTSIFEIDSNIFCFDNNVLPSKQDYLDIGNYPLFLQDNTMIEEFSISDPSKRNGNFQNNNSIRSSISYECDNKSLCTETVPDTQLQPIDHYFPEQDELQGYTLVEKIGEGAFAKVFRATPNKNGHKSYLLQNYNEVAIKVARKDTFNNYVHGSGGGDGYGIINKNNNNAKMGRYCPKHRRYDYHRHTHMEKYTKGRKSKQLKNTTTTWEDIQTEVLIHKLVSTGCPYIVDFIDFQESHSYYYIVLEKVNGGEVFDQLLKYTYFSEDLTRHIIYQLALAVKHLHQIGVVHRDIKLENILFEPIDYIPSKTQYYRKSDNRDTKLDEGKFIKGKGGAGIGFIKLTDFGLSKKITMNKGTATPCGTLGYTAPEVFTENNYSTKVDIWGIGCVLYTLLCGFPPFYEKDTDKLRRNICEGNFTFLKPWWDEISLDAKKLVTKLLEIDPDKRYDIDDLLNDSWLNNYDCDKKRSKLKIFNISIERGKKDPLYAEKKSVHSTFSKNNNNNNSGVQRSREEDSNTASATRFNIKPKHLLKSKLQKEKFIIPNPKQYLKLDLNSSTIFKRRRNKSVELRKGTQSMNTYTTRK